MWRNLGIWGFSADNPGLHSLFTRYPSRMVQGCNPLGARMMLELLLLLPQIDALYRAVEGLISCCLITGGSISFIPLLVSAVWGLVHMVDL